MQTSFGIPLHHIPAKYAEDFQTNLIFGNLKKCYLISILGGAFSPILLLLNYLRWRDGAFEANPYYLPVGVTHAIFLFFIPIAIFLKSNLDVVVRENETRARAIVGLCAGLMTLALLPMSIFSLLGGGSLLVYCIYIMVANLIITIGHAWRLRLNLAIVFIMMLCVGMLFASDPVFLLAREIEILAASIPAYASSTFHFNAKVKEFEAAQLLKQEQQRSERLLLNILPTEIAQELKESGAAKPRFHPAATVLFVDFVDFTSAASQMSATDLVEELNVYFKGFDEVCRRHSLEKIKTIGDAYLAVSGIPQGNPRHAHNAASAALEILEFMEKEARLRQQQGRIFFRGRIGLHCGPLVSGVVGSDKFAYDVWGDTVNTTSRIETSGIADKINISEAFRVQVEPDFACSYRGRVALKNKGEMDLYFLDGQREPA
jgi:class 3 adenylate cyclase